MSSSSASPLLRGVRLCFFFFGLFLCVSGVHLHLQQQSREQMTCNPKTEVCLATGKNAVDETVFDCVKPADGQQVAVDPSVKEVKVCGFGTFHFSPMACGNAPSDRFGYKAATFDKTKGDGSCEVHMLDYETTCYKVDC